MSLDLTQFHDSFFAESLEALDAMEATLLKLVEGAVDGELINMIFRGAHSIKVGAATFGFTNVAEFTHTVETLLDQLRSGNRSVNGEIIDVLLKYVDATRDILSATRSKQVCDEANVKGLRAHFEAILSKDADAESTLTASSAAPATVKSSASLRAGWRIQFTPGPELLRHGNDPLRVMRDLASLGRLTTRVDATRLPRLQDLDAEICMISWTLELESNVPRLAVEQVFEWSLGECFLVIDPLAGENADATEMRSTHLPAVDTTPTSDATPVHREESSALSKGTEKGSIRVELGKIDELMHSIGELMVTQSVLSQHAALLEGRGADEMRSALVQLDRHMRSLQENVMRVRMLPISFVFNRFPRLIRDLGQRLGKKLQIKMSGEATELDKTAMEKIGDPLVHLVRNSVDHGIETPDKRLAAGKPEVGTIHLRAYLKGGNIVVEVSDDGGGLNRDKILAKARERGLVGPNEELSEDRIFNLVFAPGFSTADAVSDVSGRGVGMDVVRRNVNELGGHVQIVSAPGEGSTVRIRLPLTLATLDGQLARVGQEIYVVPIASIVETVQARREQVKSISGRTHVLRLQDDYLPILRPFEQFGIESELADVLHGFLIIVEADGKRAAIYVDELLSQQPVVIKRLESNFRQVPGLVGATALRDGRVAMILDISGLIESFEGRERKRAEVAIHVA